MAENYPCVRPTNTPPQRVKASYLPSNEVSPIPPDIRYLTRPVHTLLSPASAGVPGDEAADINLIREDWLRKKVQKDVVAGCEQNIPLR